MFRIPRYESPMLATPEIPTFLDRRELLLSRQPNDAQHADIQSLDLVRTECRTSLFRDTGEPPAVRNRGNLLKREMRRLCGVCAASVRRSSSRNRDMSVAEFDQHSTPYVVLR